MIKHIKYDKYLREVLDKMEKGLFLTVKSKEKINTMTIGWGSIGIIWGKPIFTVAVRNSRYTHSLIENSNNFTVSIPLEKDMNKELIYCGTKSGRDVDKIKECNLILRDGINTPSPVIENCSLHYECKIVYKHDINLQVMDKEICEKCYKDGDYHTLYYGEIVDCYLIP
ncbi:MULTISPECIES: flavin reductase family protein [Tissierellales]|jgi:flavin reductase (DIM6/NTAB) family NADH-FMN oxidoreductase RutF|uniref:Flavin reductase family protein n=1 Tax=Acidilutibacter cellobiosedens TaxID=2507161 RepID=A0A410QEW5_9FIRM|nr:MULTISPECIES: flavin reductase family protein [Tissierellales]MBE6083449.1 flavin reductase family protein [Tissierellaceae bacterium]QAT62613.1 flavin reductase family protein [Acidilutibacter cellobiosedens]SCL93941.1 Flavoredoxin [Sporanaerobacter sp. PP17-6a]